MYQLFFKSPHAERGQALPILALALIGLLAFAGLALDGGNLYTEQRRAQAAADNAALAAAYEQMNGATNVNTLRETALDNAAQNDYNNDQTRNWVSFHAPPLDGPYAGQSDYLQVIITETVDTALIHLVYGGPVRLTVRAVAHGVPSGPIMAGYAIAAMNPGVCNGNDFTARGGVESIIEGGGIFVNADCDEDAVTFTGHNARIATTHVGVYPPDGAFPIDVVGAQDDIVNCNPPPTPYYSPAGCNLYPPATFHVPQVDPDPMAQSPVQPDTIPCGPAQTPGNGNPVTVSPGSYENLNVGNKTLILQPGIYCITGVGSANKVLDADSIVGHGVMIYIQQVNAEFKFAGQGVLDLSAMTQADCDADESKCPYVGLVIFKPYGRNTCGSNDIEIEFGGNADMIVRGLIYAPQSYFAYSGNGNLYLVGQALAGCGRYAGNGTLHIIYDPEATYSPPPRVRLDQ
jgi:hypothetical protein